MWIACRHRLRGKRRGVRPIPIDPKQSPRAMKAASCQHFLNSAPDPKGAKGRSIQDQVLSTATAAVERTGLSAGMGVAQGPPVDQGGFCASQRMGAKQPRVQSGTPDPPRNKASILAGRHIGLGTTTTPEQELAGSFVGGFCLCSKARACGASGWRSLHLAWSSSSVTDTEQDETAV